VVEPELFRLRNEWNDTQLRDLLLKRRTERKEWEEILRFCFARKIPVFRLRVLSKVPVARYWRTEKSLTFDEALDWVLKGGNLGGKGGDWSVIVDCDSKKIPRRLWKGICRTLYSETAKGYNFWLQKDEYFRRALDRGHLSALCYKYPALDNPGSFRTDTDYVVLPTSEVCIYQQHSTRLHLDGEFLCNCSPDSHHRYYTREWCPDYKNKPILSFSEFASSLLDKADLTPDALDLAFWEVEARRQQKREGVL
jgi:hypothetical protein